MNMAHTLSMLEGDTTVSAYLLQEDDELMEMMQSNTDYSELLEYINENY